MVGWGTDPTDIENPQKVASSEGEELYVGNRPPFPRYLLFSLHLVFPIHPTSSG